ncbi:hypothetical protein CDAR_314391 [Caerostris darwini]|uniref:Uncharacterized protein n=1 Tax=Caerostris darwini TaxID=1538125 RepID=A0AAV4W6Y7_9ARAC|nr:hypothetical protein CDAR_314391 [Caerostris darwini]
MTTRPSELTGQRVSHCFPIIRPTVRPKRAGRRTHFSPFSRSENKNISEHDISPRKPEHAVRQTLPSYRMTTRPCELTGQRVSNCFQIIRPTVRPKRTGKRTHFSPFSRSEKKKVSGIKEEKLAINISRKMHDPMLNDIDTIDEDVLISWR